MTARLSEGATRNPARLGVEDLQRRKEHKKLLFLSALLPVGLVPWRAARPIRVMHFYGHAQPRVIFTRAEASP